MTFMEYKGSSMNAEQMFNI